MLTSNPTLYSYRRAGRCAAILLLAVACCGVASAITITSSSPLPGGSLGQSYSYQFSATNAIGPVQWGIQSGSVPGLKLSTEGELSGIPNTAGVFNINVQALDIQAEASAQ